MEATNRAEEKSISTIELNSPNLDFFNKYAELSNSTNMLLMRHACSEMNEASRGLRKNGKTKAELKKDA